MNQGPWHWYHSPVRFVDKMSPSPLCIIFQHIFTRSLTQMVVPWPFENLLSSSCAQEHQWPWHHMSWSCWRGLRFTWSSDQRWIPCSVPIIHRLEWKMPSSSCCAASTRPWRRRAALSHVLWPYSVLNTIGGWNWTYLRLKKNKNKNVKYSRKDTFSEGKFEWISQKVHSKLTSF